MKVEVVSSNEKEKFQNDLQAFLNSIKGQEIVDIKFATSDDRGQWTEYSALVMYRRGII